MPIAARRLHRSVVRLHSLVGDPEHIWPPNQSNMTTCITASSMRPKHRGMGRAFDWSEDRCRGVTSRDASRASTACAMAER